MGGRDAWEAIYAESRHQSVWPWSDVVTQVMRHGRPEQNNYRVLELGCGPGANIPFFLSLNADYFSVEGSSVAVEQIHARYPTLVDNVVVGDFTADIPFAGKFDLILDRGSLTHNDTAGMQDGLRLVAEKLAPNGTFVVIDWFSTEFSEFASGEPTEDHHVRRNFTTGRLADTGLAHFADRAKLDELLAGFEIVALEHKIIEQMIPNSGARFASWNIVARQPSNAI